MARRCCSPPDRRWPQLSSRSSWSTRCGEADGLEGLRQRRVRVGALDARIGDGAAQGADRDVGPLRQQHHAGPVRDSDVAAPERPDAGDGAEQGRFAGAGRAGQQGALAGPERHAVGAQQLAPVGEMHVDVVEAELGARSLGERHPPAGGAALAHAGDGRLEGGQAVDHRLVVGEGGVGRDEEGQGRFDAAEGADGLLHVAERDAAGEEIRRRDKVGHDHVGLEIAEREGLQLQIAADDRHVVADDVGEAAGEALALGRLAFEEGDLLGVFAQPRQREADNPPRSAPAGS